MRASPRARCRASAGSSIVWCNSFLDSTSGRRSVLLPMAGRAESEGQGGRKDSQRERGCGDRGEFRGQEGDHWYGRGHERVNGAFWLAFLRSLSARGLSGVDLVISDAHRGLRDAIATVFAGANWQRCRTHYS